MSGINANLCSEIDSDNKLDAVLVVDRTCRKSDSDNYCSLRQQFIAELLNRIKGRDKRLGDGILSRVAYFEINNMGPSTQRVTLDDSTYNEGRVSPADINGYYSDIEGFECAPASFIADGDDTDPDLLTTDTFSAVKDAALELGGGRADATKMIIVISDCENTPDVSTSDVIQNLCAEPLQNRLDGSDIKVVFINFGSDDTSAQFRGAPGTSYQDCIAEDGGIFNIDLEGNGDVEDIADTVEDVICTAAGGTSSGFGDIVNLDGFIVSPFHAMNNGSPPYAEWSLIMVVLILVFNLFCCLASKSKRSSSSKIRYAEVVKEIDDEEVQK